VTTGRSNTTREVEKCLVCEIDEKDRKRITNGGSKGGGRKEGRKKWKKGESLGRAKKKNPALHQPKKSDRTYRFAKRDKKKT